MMLTKPFDTPKPPAQAGRDIIMPTPDLVLNATCQPYCGAIRARLYGPAGAPLIVVLGGISAGRYLCEDRRGWWSGIVGKGRVIDTTAFQVLGMDYLPGDAQAGTCPDIHPADQAAALDMVLQRLGITRVFALVGLSYGALVALSFAIASPDKAGRLALFGGAHRPLVMAAARRKIQRRIVRLAAKLGDAEAGLALARQLSMTTYRSADEFDARFACDPDAAGNYLEARGQAFAQIMSPARFCALSRSIDQHWIDPKKLSMPLYLSACEQDEICPPSLMHELAEKAPAAHAVHVFRSAYGHDSFLKDTAVMTAFLSTTLEGPDK